MVKVLKYGFKNSPVLLIKLAWLSLKLCIYLEYFVRNKASEIVASVKRDAYVDVLVQLLKTISQNIFTSIIVILKVSRFAFYLHVKHKVKSIDCSISIYR